MCGEFMNDPPKLYLPHLYLRYSVAPKPDAKKEVKKENVQKAVPMQYEELNMPQRPSIDGELADKLNSMSVEELRAACDSGEELLKIYDCKFLSLNILL